MDLERRIDSVMGRRHPAGKARRHGKSVKITETNIALAAMMKAKTRLNTALSWMRLPDGRSAAYTNVDFAISYLQTARGALREP
jgi:hypothetical protein